MTTALPSAKRDIVSRIQKLMRLATSSNQHEAELASQRASEMMARYQIDHADLELQAVKSGSEEVISERFVVPGQKLKVLWLNTLAHAAARLYDGEILISPCLHEQVVYFVGFKSEIELMKDTFLHLYRSWSSFVERDLMVAKSVSELEHGHTYEPRDTMKFKHGHGQGYASALFRRCSALTEQRKREVSDSCTALVLVRDGAIRQWMEAMFGAPEKRKAAKFGHKATAGAGIGYQFGAQAGNSVALGGSLAGGAEQGRLS